MLKGTNSKYSLLLLNVSVLLIIKLPKIYYQISVSVCTIVWVSVFKVQYSLGFFLDINWTAPYFVPQDYHRHADFSYEARVCDAFLKRTDPGWFQYSQCARNYSLQCTSVKTVDACIRVGLKYSKLHLYHCALVPDP